MVACFGGGCRRGSVCARFGRFAHMLVAVRRQVDAVVPMGVLMGFFFPLIKEYVTIIISDPVEGVLGIIDFARWNLRHFSSI